MQDPLADKAQGWTAYRYGFNNPMRFRFTDPTGMFEAGMMRAGKNASIQERSAGKDTQNMEGETDALDEGRNQNLQNSVLGFLDAQGTEGSNSNSSRGGLQSMADAGRFSLGDKTLKSGQKAASWAGNLSGLAGVLQIGTLNYRQSLSIHDKVGTFSKFRNVYKSLGAFSKTLGKGANLVGIPLSLYLDYDAYQKHDISLTRYTYRTTGLGLSVGGGAAIGAIYGGPYGAAGGAFIGGAFQAGEIARDGIKWLWNETGKQINNFNNAVNNWWYPGR